MLFVGGDYDDPPVMTYISREFCDKMYTKAFTTMFFICITPGIFKNISSLIFRHNPDDTKAAHINTAITSGKGYPAGLSRNSVNP